ncbi:MAG: SDR family NAD(P)-dependent oxidoreductase [Actinophytocola sp.]|uniref:SDR family NAD(P)-dependent oxidoreductase n=1 Tax=Actinophytocola sp. TaxID=1872138 RepID=UPI00132245A6|nr:SDR family NAD(P)-dependent oxidoreductase [Actinophytocola sp.]MPZ80082.1 SDR family NAD(P)-dependent oxidoreductase [Actinophytocola sp.]
MDLTGAGALVTGGASGLGLATTRRLLDAGARVTVLDRDEATVERVGKEFGGAVEAVLGDVGEAADVRAAVGHAAGIAPLRVVVHCAGRGGALRILDRDGNASEPTRFHEVVRVNLYGTFNVLQAAAAAIGANPLVGEERGVVVLTASVAAYEGQIGQLPYAASKAAIVGLTLPAARDLASRRIRVVTIAPGLFDTPLLGGLREDIRQGLAASVPHPQRLGDADEYAALALHIVSNPMLNGETIRLDGALRMAPR